MHNRGCERRGHHPEGGRPPFGGHGFPGRHGEGPHQRGGFGFGGPGHGGPGFGGPGFGGFGPGGRGGHGGGHGGPGGRGGRMRRGEARFLLLDILRDGPKHGYEIMKTLEEKSGGQYAPSPGTVYPTLQFLQDMGLIRSDQDGERRVFALTDAGRAELEKHSAEIAAFWERLNQAAPDPAQFHEIGFLKEEMEDLNRTVWNNLRAVMATGDRERIRAVRRALEKCKNEIRDIIARDSASGEDGETA